MDFQIFIENLKRELNSELPGEDAQMLMSPLGRKRHSQASKLFPNPKLSAVLIAIYPKEDVIHTLLMVRNTYKGHHSGQVSFPGGKVEETDESLEQTALREFQEEMGVPTNNLEIAGKLSPLIVPPSGFIIHPYVGVFNADLSLKPDKIEVASVIKTSLDTLFNNETKSIQLVHSSSVGIKLKAPSYIVDGNVVWGATAMILSELEVLCKRFHF
ncbi:MAG: NUDIX hydrolase [Salibacteraceae bacterium]